MDLSQFIESEWVLKVGLEEIIYSSLAHYQLCKIIS